MSLDTKIHIGLNAYTLKPRPDCLQQNINTVHPAEATPIKACTRLYLYHNFRINKTAQQYLAFFPFFFVVTWGFLPFFSLVPKFSFITCKSITIFHLSENWKSKQIEQQAIPKLWPEHKQILVFVFISSGILNRNKNIDELHMASFVIKVEREREREGVDLFLWQF